MKLKWFKHISIGGMILAHVIKWVPLGTSWAIIHPFLLTPSVEIEGFNYVAGIVGILSQIILLYVILKEIEFSSRVNADRAFTNWVKAVTYEKRPFAKVFIVYQTKELVDFLLFYNVFPESVDYTLFLFFWEFIPFASLLIYATYKAKIKQNVD